MTALSARTARILRASASTLVLGIVSLSPTAAYAQDPAQAAEETKPISAQTDPDAAASPDAETAADGAIIVTGQRRALQSAAQIKRNADTVVDSITATDIGAFPDKSVAEALQRVPGITVNRFAATSDTAHFSAEPSGVIVRGLPQVRSEFNGRDTFSANSSRGLSWGDITPELMARVDVYKNQTAELIEGGIAAVQINALAQKLGVTRGGFYWRFRNRQDLLDHLLLDWHDRNTRHFLMALERTGTPEERYRRMVRMFIDERDFNPALDSAIRQWGSVDPAVGDKVREADEQRIQSLKRLFVEAGQDEEESLVRARIVYFHQIGYYALDMRETRDQRRALAPIYDRILTGF